jgi:threonine aldolase
MPIDLRSDTVTRPTETMRRAMAAAEVGDDIYGEDPTVNRLQEVVADLLGHEAALFFPTGTMANETAVRVLTRRGDEVLVEERSHVVQYELAGLAALSGVAPRVLRTADGHLDAGDVRAARRPYAYHRSDTTLCVLENTHNLAGGTVCDAERFASTVSACRETGLKVHLDGARIWNAAAALGVRPKVLAAGVDSVMVTLSKGLCAPAGSLLAGPSSLVAEARRVRKQLGGGMRQVGVLAAAGLVGLELADRLGEDHANADVLRQALASVPGVRVARGTTNIALADIAPRDAPAVVAELARRGVLASAMDGSTLRLVTHHDVGAEDCRRAAELVAAVLQGMPRV